MSVTPDNRNDPVTPDKSEGAGSTPAVPDGPNTDGFWTHLVDSTKDMIENAITGDWIIYIKFLGLVVVVATVVVLVA